MRKTVFFLVLTALILGPAFSAGAAAKVTVTFWHDWSLEGAKTLNDLVAQFNASHPDIEVKPLATGSIIQKLMTSVAGKVPPDVVLFDRFMTGQFAARNALMPLDGYLKKDKLDAKAFFPSIWSEGVYEGKTFGIPMNTDTRALLYNKAVFREVGLDPKRPPRNWKELEEYSDKLTKYDSSGKLVRIGFSPIFGNGSLSHFVWQNGGDIFDSAKKKVIFNNQAGLEALEWVVKYVDKFGYENLLKFQSGFATTAGNLTPLINGQQAMIYEGVWNLGDLRKYAPDFYAKDLGIAPFPKGKEYATLAGGFSLIIPRGAKNPEAAWEFIKFVTYRRESQMEIASRTGVIPALMAAAKDPSFTKDKFWKVFVDAMDYARIRPVHPAFPEIDALMIGATDAAVRHRSSPKEALDEAARKAQIILDRYNAHFGKK